jgi:PAS domain S-box-containing protein
MDYEGLGQIIADNVPVLVWMSNTDKTRIYVNKRWLDFTGCSSESAIGNGWTRCIHSEDLPQCLETYSESFDQRQEFKMEYRLRRYDGEFRWMCDMGVPFYKVDGSFAGYIGSCFDITDRKLLMEELSQGNTHLIEAQEQERTRIARELHDDIGSSLAILGIEMLRAGQPVSGSPGRKHPGIEGLYEKLREISSRVSHISHQLHSPMLEYIGLAQAINAECQKFSEEGHLPVSCSCKDLPALDYIVALSFLRVVQEALHNAAKHSQATRVAVEVMKDGSVITLQVLDNGKGFDVEQSRLARGIGLISMRERMRLIGGVCEIWSEPGKGTRITCRAPLTRSGVS